MTAGLSAVSVPIASSAFGDTADFPRPRRLLFHHTHTGEKLNVLYWQRGDYVQPALVQINQLLRDVRTGDVQPIDVALLDLLHRVYVDTGSNGEFQIISAYRSSKTNAMLRNKSNNVAKRSLHMVGKAIDVRLTDVPLADLRTIAYGLKRGGVGYYPKSNFVHLDTGRFRTW